MCFKFFLWLVLKDSSGSELGLHRSGICTETRSIQGERLLSHERMALAQLQGVKSFVQVVGRLYRVGTPSSQKEMESIHLILVHTGST